MKILFLCGLAVLLQCSAFANAQCTDIKPVAFHATLRSGHFGPRYTLDAIKFNDVSLNIGNGYNPKTGKFTAPIDGIFHFSVSCLQGRNQAATVQIIKDGVMYSEMHSYVGNWDQLSNGAVMQLKKGQEVWARLVYGAFQVIDGRGRYNTFLGYLIPY